MTFEHQTQGIIIGRVEYDSNSAVALSQHRYNSDPKKRFSSFLEYAKLICLLEVQKGAVGVLFFPNSSVYRPFVDGESIGEYVSGKIIPKVTLSSISDTEFENGLRLNGIYVFLKRSEIDESHRL